MTGATAHRTKRAFNRKWSIVTAAVACASLLAGPTARAADDQVGAKLLAEQIKKANQEGKLVATVQSSWSHAMLPALVEGFKKRFGLTIDVTLRPVAAARQ